MFENPPCVPVNKKWAVIGFVISILCILGLILARLINTASRAGDLAEQRSASYLTMGIAGVLALLSVAGLIISAVALIRSVRKREAFGGKGLAIAGLIINGIFALIFVISFAFIAVVYFSSRAELAKIPNSPSTNSGTASDWSFDKAYPRGVPIAIAVLYRDFYTDRDKGEKIIKKIGTSGHFHFSGTFKSLATAGEYSDLTVSFNDPGPAIHNAQGNVDVKGKFKEGDRARLVALKTGQDLQFECAVYAGNSILELSSCSLN